MAIGKNSLQVGHTAPGNTSRVKITNYKHKHQLMQIHTNKVAKWKLARPRCNLDTLLQETPQGWRSHLNWRKKTLIFHISHISTKYLGQIGKNLLQFGRTVNSTRKHLILALSSHLSRPFFCIISAKKFCQNPFKGAEVEVGVSCKLAMAICIGNTWRQEICIGSTRRQECMEEAAKWQFARTRCNLDTLLQQTPQGWRFDHKLQTQTHTNT